MPEKRKNLNALMHQLILDDPICARVKGKSSYLIAAEYANDCESKAEMRLGLV